MLGLICKSFECRDSDVMAKLYKTLVRLIIEYNNVIWGSFYILDNQKIERVQHRVTRMIPSIRQLPHQDRLKHLNNTIFTISGDLIYLYQILKGNYKIDNHLFIPSTSTTRGHTMKLFITQIQAQDQVFIINDWNSLLQSIVDSPSVNVFKTLLDRHFSDCLFDFVVINCIFIVMDVQAKAFILINTNTNISCKL